MTIETPPRMSPRRGAALAPLFLISLTAIGFEIALTRYFAIASWSEYGYWVISITMVGFGVSGVVLSLFKDFFLRYGPRLLFASPMLLMLCGAVGFYFTTVNPFNPLEFQNPDLWAGQLVNIWRYYAVLFPFFFLTGLYIGLYFLLYQDEIPHIYGADLAGAGAGALLILFLMFTVHPFYLLAALLPLLVLAALYHVPPALRSRRVWVAAAALIVLVLSESVVVGLNRADFNQYKSIYPPLHVQGNRIVSEIRSPRGYFLLLDNFTERLDVDLSNNFAVLAAAGPPSTYGLYSDGNRLTSLPESAAYDRSYIKAALDAFPYELRSAPRVLLIGTRGGFRLREALDMGATQVVALEPDETLFALVRQSLKQVFPALFGDRRIQLRRTSPAMMVAGADERYDIVDIASDFVGQGDANKFAFTVEAIRGYLGMLSDDGVVSVPVSIRESPVYAVKMLETVRWAAAAAGIAEPTRHIMVYRSSWNARIIVSKRPFASRDVERLRAFCERRSFDTSYFPGIDPATVEIWNDLPLVSFEQQAVVSSADKASDALMAEALKLFGGQRRSFLTGHFFNLEPSTYDRPFFYSILRIGELGSILERIALIPREEIGYLINLAVLFQAVLFAALVLALPLVRWRHARPRTGALVKSVLYFAALGLGFLFIEILLIEKVSFFLNDRTYAFAMVLTGMLVFSGLGSYTSGRFLSDPRRGITLAAALIAICLLLALGFLDSLLFAAINLPLAVKALLVVALIAPLSFALGFPFPLGLSLFRGEASHFLPWAWSLNGAFSVISTPLANLLAISAGYNMVLLLSLLLYVMAYFTFPVTRGESRIH